ncbi:hypothetical protein C8J56DRAFT_901576 [Mycena floridula]|nr:hypothetical protein C8J56DRAFT_901576 [Mycena floridula]
MTFSREGKILVTGGDDCSVRTWSVTTKGLAVKQSLTEPKWGPITAITIIYNRPPLALKQTIICLGAVSGLVFIEIVDDYYSIFDEAKGLSASLSFFKPLLISPGGLTFQSAVSIPGLLSGLRFRGNSAEHITTLDISGSLKCLDVNDCHLVFESSLRTVLGGGAFSKNGRGCACFNLQNNSFQVHRIGQDTFASAVVPQSAPHFNSCVFSENDDVLITASDHGWLYVFSTDKGAQRQTMEHVRNIRVELIEVGQTPDEYLIASVACRPNSTICLFRKVQRACVGIPLLTGILRTRNVEAKSGQRDRDCSVRTGTSIS